MEAACDALKKDASRKRGDLEDVCSASNETARAWVANREPGGPTNEADANFAST